MTTLATVNAIEISITADTKLYLDISPTVRLEITAEAVAEIINSQKKPS